ncbi:hypothetical protein ACFXDH_10880 [Streptomyces sp. NPDC059467]|uniref:hypothetical protein n=1 Tax=Streptomyces sp. NPDC059467 TaxID=3346844 RepID=UPI0036944A94
MDDPDLVDAVQRPGARGRSASQVVAFRRNAAQSGRCGKEAVYASTVFHTEDASAGLGALRQALDAPRALRDYGMPEDGIAKALGPIMKAIPANNPTPVTYANLTMLLQAAWAGDPVN